MTYIRLSDLPIELLPLLFEFIVKPSHLAKLCLVNTTFRDLVVPLLYESIYVYPWHTESKVRVVQLFNTLCDNADLARYVKKLVIKDFPKALQTAALEDIWSTCATGLRNCVNLKHCTWTRDGSLSNDILEALLDCSNFSELEINGHHNGQYDPDILCRFTKLDKLTLIMPSGSIIDYLPCWIKETGPTLRYLSLICKASSLITDWLLESVAPNLLYLEHFSLLGCPKVTHKGILAILHANVGVMKGLGLEGLSPNFDIAAFSAARQTSDSLAQLRSFTTTIQLPLETWTLSILNLLQNAPLEIFQVYSPGGVGSGGNSALSIFPDDFCSQFVLRHGECLRRFSVHRMRVSLEAIHDICTRCPNLEQLFIVVRRDEMKSLGAILAKARKLRSVHVNFPLDAGSTPGLIFAKVQWDVESILKECTESSITQFGCNTRVWQVERAVIRGNSGEMTTETRLTRYERPEVPEQFLVLRA